MGGIPKQGSKLQSHCYVGNYEQTSPRQRWQLRASRIKHNQPFKPVTYTATLWEDFPYTGRLPVLAHLPILASLPISEHHMHKTRLSIQLSSSGRRFCTSHFQSNFQAADYDSAQVWPIVHITRWGLCEPSNEPSPRPCADGPMLASVGEWHWARSEGLRRATFSAPSPPGIAAC